MEGIEFVTLDSSLCKDATFTVFVGTNGVSAKTNEGRNITRTREVEKRKTIHRWKRGVDGSFGVLRPKRCPEEVCGEV